MRIRAVLVMVLLISVGTVSADPYGLFGGLAHGLDDDATAPVDDLWPGALDILGFRIGHVRIHDVDANLSGPHLVLAVAVRDAADRVDDMLPVIQIWGIVSCDEGRSASTWITMQPWDEHPHAEESRDAGPYKWRPVHVEDSTFYALLPPVCAGSGRLNAETQYALMSMDRVPDQAESRGHPLQIPGWPLADAGPEWYDAKGRPVAGPETAEEASPGPPEEAVEAPPDARTDGADPPDEAHPDAGNDAAAPGATAYVVAVAFALAAFATRRRT